jgi:hypothetical protein
MGMKSYAKGDSIWREIFSELWFEDCVKKDLLIQGMSQFLYAVSKNASNRVLQDQFQHSGETISRHFAAVLNALTQLTCHYICLPSPHPHHILRQPKFSPYFQVIKKIVHFHVNLTIFNICKVGLLC